MVEVMHFFKPPAAVEDVHVIDIYSNCCQLVETVAALDKSIHFAAYGTIWFERGLALAACALLRLLKTPFGDILNKDEGGAIFLLALQVFQNFSTDPSDGPSRCNKALHKLWSSETVFKSPDGEWNLELRLRSRFSMSVLWDLMWWYREEFTGQATVYKAPSRTDSRHQTPHLTPRMGTAQRKLLFEKILTCSEITDLSTVQSSIPLSMRFSQGMSQGASLAAPVAPVVPMMPTDMPLEVAALDDWWFPPDIAFQDAQWNQSLVLKDGNFANGVQYAEPLPVPTSLSVYSHDGTPPL